MSRPVRIPIASGTQGWDATIDNNLIELFDNPIPIPQPAALTEANLAATYAVAAYDRCFVWVNHTVYGYILYYSDGTNWLPHDPAHTIARVTTVATTLTAAEMAGIFLCGGTMPQTHVLPTAASMKGRRLMFKTTVTGTLTIDGSGAETIDGAATITITAQYGTQRIFSDGTTWWTV